MPRDAYRIDSKLRGGNIHLLGSTAGHISQANSSPVFVSKRVVTKEKGGKAQHHTDTTCKASKQNTRDNRTSHRNPRASLRGKARADQGPKKRRMKQPNSHNTARNRRRGQSGNPHASPNHLENGKPPQAHTHISAPFPPHQNTASRAPGPKQARNRTKRPRELTQQQSSPKRLHRNHCRRTTTRSHTRTNPQQTGHGPHVIRGTQAAANRPPQQSRPATAQQQPPAHEQTQAHTHEHATKPG